MKRKKTKAKRAFTPPQAKTQPPRPPIRTVAKAETFAGPLPPPVVLEKYNQIVPGAADRIIAMAENQSQHRRELESTVIGSEIANSRLGLHYGLIIGLTAIIGGVICIMAGHETGGSIIGGAGLSGLVGVFVYGSRQRRKEREKRFDLVKKPNQQ
jgi:uncharacterized membrane protein